jgi:hypothetical protein
MYAKARRRHQAYFSITLCLFHGISLSLNEPGLAFSLGWNLSSTRHPPVSALSELEGADTFPPHSAVPLLWRPFLFHVLDSKPQSSWLHISLS